MSPLRFSERFLADSRAASTVVTTRKGAEVHGTTMSAFSSVSLSPPLVLVCVDRKSEIHNMLGDNAIFAINILHQGQAGIAEALSHKGTPELNAAHRLESVPFHTAETGAPILDGPLGLSGLSRRKCGGSWGSYHLHRAGCRGRTGECRGRRPSPLSQRIWSYVGRSLTGQLRRLRTPHADHPRYAPATVAQGSRITCKSSAFGNVILLTWTCRLPTI